MKLFKRIFLQVFVGCLLLSQVPLLYFLHESQRQSIKDTVSYEEKNFRLNWNEFQTNLREKCGQENGREMRDLVAVNEFRVIFGSNGALFQEGGELFNFSPYEFDWEGLKSRGESSHGALKLGRDVMYPGVSLQTAEGRKLLIFCEEQSLPQEEAGMRGYQVLYYKDITNIFERTESLFLRGLCFTAVLLAVTGIVLFWGIYRSIRPLQELRVAASSIAGGDYESRVPVRRKDEIGELAASFNQMAGKVEEHVERLFQTNEAQRQLIGSLAHELKTPMTAIIGYSDTLLTVELSEKRRIQALNYIRSEGRRLSRLAAKMLELTGLYESGYTITRKETQVAGLLGRLRDLTSYRLREKNIRLETVCTPETLTLPMDEDLMMSLLMNLVDNAFKASPRGSIIAVSADKRGILVEDGGRGIPAAEISRVTEAFYMVDKSRSRSAGSVGLGLAFCRQIAELHEAQIVIESEEGKGTRVSVLWPGAARRSSPMDE